MERHNKKNIRNFVIVAHIDHGKSTLADRLLELTGTIEKRKMQEQFLDTMELERERGITIKLQPVRMLYKYQNPKSEISNKPQIQNHNIQNNLGFRNSDLEFTDSEQEFVLNLIDTPGHVDFSYEVSRSLAAVEGAVLLVDASKGIQAQTLANLHLAQEQGLTIIPAVNKIDLPNARTKEVKEELSNLLGVEEDGILEISGKTGMNVEKILERIIKDIPPPGKMNHELRIMNYGQEDQLKALIFDSSFDVYKGVIAYIRVFSGSVKREDKVLYFATKTKSDVIEVGYFAPKLKQCEKLSAGDIGYIATGLKDPGQVRVGDTITNQFPISNFQFPNKEFQPLAGYKEPRPMVFASFFPENADDLLKDALGKLKLTDASLTYEPESSAGLGRGYRLGFLGMLHIEIISERLKRESGLQLVVSTPSVEYIVKLKNGEEVKIRSAALMPDPSRIESIAEPTVNIEIIKCG